MSHFDTMMLGVIIDSRDFFSDALISEGRAELAVWRFHGHCRLVDERTPDQRAGLPRLHHLGRGSQFASDAYLHLLDTGVVSLSMSDVCL